MNYFYVDGELLHESEMFGDRFHTGLGVIWSNGDRYRVVDTWFSVDHHGHFEEGLHIFMEKLANPDDDLPKKLAPTYFEGGAYKNSRKW